MNRNATALILIVLAIGMYFTVTQSLIDKNKAIAAVNDQYKVALKNSEELIAAREKVNQAYNNLSEENRDKLEKMLPSSVDNIRLIIDLNNIALKHGFPLKNVKAVTNKNQQQQGGAILREMPVPKDTGSIKIPDITIPTLDTVSVAFSVTAPYLNFISFLQDVESNLRIMDVSKINMTATETGVYDFNVELKTYWLKQ